MASKFWVMHGAMKPVSRGRKEVRSRYPSGAWLLACWLVALPVHADPPGADLSSRPRSGPDMLADLGADSAPPTKDPRAHAVSADAPHDAHDHPSADEPDEPDDVDDPIEDPLLEHSLPDEGSDDAEDPIEDPPPGHEDDATDDDVVDVDGADRADDGASPSTALPDPEARHPKAKLYGDPRPPGVRGVPMGTTRYTRTGLHLRANLGLGYLHIFNSSSAHLGDDAFSAEDAAVAALPLDLELWAGGALTRDLALNLVIRSGQASGGKLHATPDTLDLKGGLTTAFLGAGLLYHLDPARGWLVGLAAGFERWQARLVRGAAPQVGGSGVAASLYGGHDWWLTPDTAFGLLARLNLGFATGDGRAEVGQLQLENSDLDFYLQGGLAVSLSYF